MRKFLEWMNRVRLVLARLVFRKRTPSEEVQELKKHLADAVRDDIKLIEQSRRKNKLVRDNHLVTDVKNALGLRP